MTEPTLVTAAEFASLDLADWRFVFRRIKAIYRTDSYGAAAKLAGDIGAAAEAAGHHPDLDIRYPNLLFASLATQRLGGVLTDRDMALARQISDLARRAGARAEPESIQTVEIAIDALDNEAIRPFWNAILGFVDDVAPGYAGTPFMIMDPARLAPAFWFQDMKEPRSERNRFHVDIAVPHDVAEQRIAAALVAGGTLLSDRDARAWWVLADSEGNEACICTWQDRP